MSGPYETGRDAFEDARVLREAVAAVDPGGDMTQKVIAARSKARVQYVRGILEVRGVELGAHDRRIVDWVAGWDVETIQTIAGWIERSHEGGHGVLLAEIRRLRQRVADLEAPAGGEG